MGPFAAQQIHRTEQNFRRNPIPKLPIHPPSPYHVPSYSSTPKYFLQTSQEQISNDSCGTARTDQPPVHRFLLPLLPLQSMKSEVSYIWQQHRHIHNCLWLLAPACKPLDRAVL